MAIGQSRNWPADATLYRSPVGREVSVVEVGQRGVRRPVEQRQREPALPGEHHRVTLDDLEQCAEDGLGQRRPAREPTARRVADRREIRRGAAEVDQLGGEVGGAPVQQRHALDEHRDRVVREWNAGEAGDRELRRVEEREPRRVDGCAAQFARGRSSKALRRERRRRSSARPPRRSRRLAPEPRRGGRRFRTRRSPLRASGPTTRARRRSSAATPRPACSSSRPSPARYPPAGETASLQAGGRLLERRERRLGVDRTHPFASNHGDGRARGPPPHAGQRGTRRSRLWVIRTTVWNSIA